MEKGFKRIWILLIIISMWGLQSCQKDEMISSAGDDFMELKNASMNTFYSSTEPVGNGVVRAFVTQNKAGDPLEVGINVSAKALEKLPSEMMQYVLELPKGKGNHFYTHVLFDWNPMGHEPPGVYDLPHFDIHFYIIPNEDRMNIPPMAPPYLDPAPDSAYIPPMHMELEGLVPGMGAHWVDLTSPELSGATFTRTFIWGSYGGEFIFWEPMITLDYLKTMPDEIIPIPQPQAYQNAGWYPTDYKISYSSVKKQYTISLVNLMYHEAE
ncbi:DUF5602 domain-containing protein [Maribellus sp. YY47]|uniref:DUF5602 domain-containing protein n=1 Tax=Maribellus sp. YY47 TaxID=2929486 RepID=UPI002000DCE6|nr:DUF5602 domain-containing protein [Maribellus sp. YY47]MCK3684737.1 DUF5602 domain-containing protein [Maribellus sp. YY47]